MPAVVLDTDVVSMEFKRDTRYRAYHPHLAGRLLVVSFMTLAELDFWALRRNWGERRREQMDRHLKKFLLHPYDRQLCREWAHVTDMAMRNGKPVATADAWIAATALLHGIPLVTNNPADYSGVDELVVVSEAMH